MLERTRIRRQHLSQNDAYMRRLMSYQPKATAWVYFIQAGEDGPIKIGTSRDPRKRFLELQTAAPYPLHVRAIGVGGIQAEHRLHARFADSRLHGEWFEPVPPILEAIDLLNRFDRDLDLIGEAVTR